MRLSKLTGFTLALVMVAILGLSTISHARGGNHIGYGNGGPAMSEERYTQMREMRMERFKAINPLQQELFAKQSELQALYYSSDKPDSAKTQALVKEIGEIKAKIYAIDADYDAKLNALGISNRGFGGRGHCPMTENGFGGGQYGCGF